MAVGICLNATNEVILFYGPNSESTLRDKDNALYRVPPGRMTPSGWDCDGICVPNDRIGDQHVGDDIPGPAAIKYGLGVIDIGFKVTQEDNRYVLPGNQGAFRPSAYCEVTNYPFCVRWSIPDIAHSQLNGYPEVPNHEPIPQS